MKKLLKFLLYTLIWVLLTGVIVTVVILLGQTWITGAKISGVLFVIWALFIIIRKIIARQKAKKRVEGLILEDDAESEQSSAPTSIIGKIRSKFPNAQQINIQFDQFQKLLGQTALKKLGNPMYVLPWYLMMGSKGAGKTSALAHAKLPAPLFDQNLLDNEGSLKFWPYNEAVIVDTPGNYLSKNDKNGSQEWINLLKILEKQRRKEPLNGITIAIDAEHLLNCDETELFEEGRFHQARIDELMKTLKIKVPIYLLVTKCNQIQGFKEFSKGLSAEGIDQATGYAREDEGQPAEAFVEKAIEKIIEGIKDLLMVGINLPSATYKLLRLPRELTSLKEKLKIFTSGAFQENPFQETPFLRGIYLCGIEKLATEETSGKGMFLRDFFTKILPADREVIGSLTTAKRAEVVTRRMFMGSWTLFIGALIGLMLWMHSIDINFIRDTTKENAGSFVMKESSKAKVEALGQLRRMVQLIDYEVSTWWIPWFGLWERPDFIVKMQSIYAERFNVELMKPLNENLNTKLIKADVELKQNNAPKEKTHRSIARQVDTFVRRLTVLDSYLKGKDLDALTELPAPFAEGGLYFPAGTNAEYMENFNSLYLQSLVWSNEKSTFEEEKAWLSQRLQDKLSTVSKDLVWIIPLANEEVKSDDKFNLKSYWSGTGSLKKEIIIPGAYTLEGKKFVDGFIERLMMTDPDSKVFKEMKILFDKAYRTAYLETWKNFALDFDKGMVSLRGRNEWADSIDVISTRHNPYFKGLNVFAEQLEPFSAGDIPEWLVLVNYYQKMKMFGPDDATDNSQQNKTLSKLALKAVGKLGPIGKAISKSGKKGMKVQKKMGKGKSGDDRDVMLEEAGKALGAYRKSLMDVAFNANSRAVSMRAMQSFFANPEEPGASGGPEAQAYNAVRKLEMLIGKANRETRPFWNLYAGPLSMIRKFMLNETSCKLQSQWKQSFLIEIEGVPKYKLGGLMFGAEGQLWTFINENASAFFVRQYGKGYVPKIVDNLKIPFTREFVNFTSIGIKAKKNAGKTKQKASVPKVITYCWR